MADVATAGSTGAKFDLCKYFEIKIDVQSASWRLSYVHFSVRYANPFSFFAWTALNGMRKLFRARKEVAPTVSRSAATSRATRYRKLFRARNEVAPTVSRSAATPRATRYRTSRKQNDRIRGEAVKHPPRYSILIFTKVKFGSCVHCDVAWSMRIQFISFFNSCDITFFGSLQWQILNNPVVLF